MPDIAEILEVSRKDPRAAYRMVEDSITPAERANWNNFGRRQECIAKAMSKPLPGMAEDAYLRGSVKIGEFTIYEVYPVHIKALQAVKSPLLGLIDAASNGEKAGAEWSSDADYEICFIFTTPPKTLQAVEKGKLADFVKVGAQSEALQSLNLADMNAMTNAVLIQYKKFNKASIARQQELEEQVGTSFFRELLAEVSKPKA